MKRSLLYITSCLVGQVLLGQNLVPNGSFEDYTQCPYDEGYITFATGWSTYRGTSDFVHVCGVPFLAGVPYNIWGYQYAATGEGYAQIISFSEDDGNPFHGREYVGRQLLVPMTVGETYFVSVKFSWTTTWDHSLGSCQYANNKMGVRFGTEPFISDDLDPVPNHAHVYTENIITDSAGWVTVSAPFVADSAYEFIAVGNFFDDVLTDWVHINPNGSFPVSLYYVDDVCVSLDSAVCDLVDGVHETTGLSKISVAPNPTSGQLNVRWQGAQMNFVIYDITGRVCWHRAINGQTLDLDISDWPAGHYLLIGESSDRLEVHRFVKL